MLSLAGIGCTLLALSARFKFVFLVWTIVAWYLMLKWFFLTGYIFDDARQSRGAVWLSFGALGAFFGAAWAMKARRGLAVL